MIRYWTPGSETDRETRLALKARLPRTWPAFFERHGNFTDAQLSTIPLLLDGHSAILCAPTASGKTEAALAPLIERHCPPVRGGGPHMLYLTPTRALANDLRARLAPALDLLGISLGLKTRDASTFRPTGPADLLLTTPESLDSLLAARPRLFAGLRAVVIDELHLFDGTPRGDQLRVLLNRIRRIRGYAAERGDAPDASIQYVALSATLAEPGRVAERYFAGARVVEISGGRAIEPEQLALSGESASALLGYLAEFRARGWGKALAFCNSRAEVEAYAAATRERSPFGGATFVHYSNIDARRRHEIERQFAEAEAAICFASSTLELGIDVGDIDVVILLGPPGSSESFIQRIGRGNRRRGVTRVACCYRTPLERLIFDALLADDRRPTTDDRRPTTDDRRPTPEPRTTQRVPARRVNQEPRGDLSSEPSVAAENQEATTDHRPLTTEGESRIKHHSNPKSKIQNLASNHLVTLSPSHLVSFRPAVAIQQMFSLIKQSKTAAVRLAELADLFDGVLSAEDIEAILGELQERAYLATGRPGEWRAGERLNELFDRQTSADPGLSIYSNIQGGPARTVDIRDQHTQQIIARVDALWLDRTALTLEGRPFEVEWCDGEAIWVASRQGQEAETLPLYRSARQLLSYELAQLLPARLGLAPGVAPFVIVPGGALWFHWLGDLYGRAALDLLRYQVPAGETAQIGLCLQVPDEPRAPPAWSESQVVRYLEDNYRAFEPLLALGPFHHLLPLRLRRRAVVEQFRVGRFLDAVAELRPVVAPEELAEDLMEIMVKG